VTAVAPQQDIESLTISAGRNKTTTHLFGITETYPSLYNQTAVSGRLISPTDVSFGRSVVVLGSTPRQRLFPGENPIGRLVRLAATNSR
jgi:putative ABC transport system permease protein